MHVRRTLLEKEEMPWGCSKRLGCIVWFAWLAPAVLRVGNDNCCINASKHLLWFCCCCSSPAAAQAAAQTRQEIVLHGPPERVREAYHLLLGNIRKYGPTNLPAGAVPNPLPFPNRGRGG